MTNTLTGFRVTRKDGTLVNPGDTVTSFRGIVATFVRVERGPLPGRSARVVVSHGDITGSVNDRSYYAEVYDLVVTPLRAPMTANQVAAYQEIMSAVD